MNVGGKRGRKKVISGGVETGIKRARISRRETQDASCQKEDGLNILRKSGEMLLLAAY